LVAEVKILHRVLPQFSKYLDARRYLKLMQIIDARGHPQVKVVELVYCALFHESEGTFESKLKTLFSYSLVTSRRSGQSKLISLTQLGRDALEGYDKKMLMSTIDGIRRGYLEEHTKQELLAFLSSESVSDDEVDRIMAAQVNQFEDRWAQRSALEGDTTR